MGTSDEYTPAAYIVGTSVGSAICIRSIATKEMALVFDRVAQGLRDAFEGEIVVCEIPGLYVSVADGDKFLSEIDGLQDRKAC